MPAKKETRPPFLSPIRCSPELLDALDAYAAKHDQTVSAVIRSAICQKIGRKDLDVTPKQGWPSGKSRKKS